MGEHTAQIICALVAELPEPYVPAAQGQCCECGALVWVSESLEDFEGEPICRRCVPPGEQLLVRPQDYMEVVLWMIVNGQDPAEFDAKLALMGISMAVPDDVKGDDE